MPLNGPQGIDPTGHVHEDGDHPDLATHNTLGLATQAELDAHEGASDPHTGYVREADANWTDLTDGGATTLHTHTGGSGAPTDVDYLVGTASAGLSNEIVVGTTPGGELGGTWASPTVDATHSGSAHVLLTANTPTAEAFGDTGAVGVGTASARDDHRHAMPANPVTAHEAAGDPHTGYQLESQKGSANGYAGLDAGSKVAAANLPSLDGITAAAASVNFNGQQATSFRIENRTSDPGTPTTGQIWLRTDL